MLDVTRKVQPVRPMPSDPPEGVSAVVYGQIVALIANSVIQLFILWAAIDAFARHEFGLVAGLAVANFVLFMISMGVLWLGRLKDRAK
ncbi:MAG TPA: hypothetical protein VH186_07170 [Chloroflexia bacterium]|nr:hypothetical protein [Chloroflexia bacterium]